MPCIGGRELVRMALEEDFKSDTLIADLSEETISRYVARRATGVLDGGRVADFIPRGAFRCHPVRLRRGVGPDVIAKELWFGIVSCILTEEVVLSPPIFLSS